MSTELEATGIEHPHVQHALKRARRRYSVGDVFADPHGEMRRIARFFVANTHYANPDYYGHVAWVEWDHRAKRWDPREHSAAICEFDRYVDDEVRVLDPIEDVADRTIGEWDDVIRREVALLGETDTETKALTALSSAERALTMERAIASRRQRVELARRMIQRRVDEASAVARKLGEQLDYLRKVIEVGNLYLGIDEVVTVLREGEPAPVSAPIVIMQSILYMDEEVGIERGYDDGNEDDYATIRWDNLEKFDDWVLEGNHLDILLPARKGIVALRVTRREPNSGSGFSRVAENAANNRIYVLVRNGERLYRLLPELYIRELLYPKLGEWNRLVEQLEKHGYDARTAQDKVFDYQKVLALIQGLFDRTTILQPLPAADINIMQPDTYADAGYLEFIRDAEPSVGSGRPSYRDWRLALAKQIVEGTRVYLGPYPYYKRDSSSGYGSHFVIYRKGDYPSPPHSGLYVARGLPKEMEKAIAAGKFRIMYNPGDRVWSYNRYDGFDDHERKLGFSFILEPDDGWVLNYDLLEIADIEWYINDRRERGAYLEMLPTLFAARRHLREEQRREGAAAELFAATFGFAIEDVARAIEWWKRRNKFKRSLTDDDKKAWRMVRRTLTTGAWRKEWDDGDADGGAGAERDDAG